jgi:hypothetical protein
MLPLLIRAAADHAVSGPLIICDASLTANSLVANTRPHCAAVV